MTTDQLSQQVRQTLDELQALSRSDEPTSRVVQRMLDLLLRTSGCSGGLLWLASREGDAQNDARRFHLAGRAGERSEPALGDNGEPADAVASALRSCVSRPDKALVVSPEQAEFAGTALGSEVQFYLAVAGASRPLGVLQVIAPGSLSPKVYREYAAFAQQTARAIAEYLHRRRSALRDEEANRSGGLLQLVRRLADLEDPDAALHEVANAARRLLQADRAAAVKLWDPRPQVHFSDAVDTNRKAVVVRTIRMLAEQAQRRDVPMVFTRGAELDEADHEIAPLIDDLFDQSTAASVCFVPIHDGEAAIAALVCEYGEADPGESTPAQQQMADQVGPHIGRLVRWRQRPLRRTAAFVEAVARNPRAATIKLAVVLAVLAAIGVGLFAVPVPIPVRVDARLEPLAMATTTAPFAGRVDEVLVRAGAAVEAGQPLMRLNTDDLEAQLAEVVKQIEIQQVNRQRAYRGAQDGSATRADIREAELEIARLNVRRDRLERRIDHATIRARIAGRVLNEDVERLEGRNLREGDGLIQVGDLRRFRLTMDIEESDLAPIQRRLAAGEPVDVTFVSRAMPNLSHKTRLTDLAAFSPTSVGDPQKKRHVFHATVPIELTGDARELAMANPSGRARIDAGRGSVVYRYFRRAYAFFRMKFWF